MLQRTVRFITPVAKAMGFSQTWRSKIKSRQVSSPCETKYEKSVGHLMFIGPCIIAIVEEWKTNLMSLAILFQLLCAQHISDILMSETCWAH